MAAKADLMPTGPGWSYEVKWDGVRCVARIERGTVSMQSRSGKSNFVAVAPHVAEQLAQLADCVIDGELVELDADGLSYGARGERPKSLVVFDVLEVAGQSVRHLPLTDRRTIVRKLLEESGPDLAVSPVFDDGPKLMAWAAEKGIEGIVAKRNDSRYMDGSRTGVWVKLKVRNEQEFVVAGWVEGKNGNAGKIGGLLLAVHDDGRLVYCGRAGARGEDQAALRAMRVRPTSPLDAKKPTTKDVTWVEPETVVQVQFQRWTEDGMLWHPVCKRIRDDKPASEVTREA